MPCIEAVHREKPPSKKSPSTCVTSVCTPLRYEIRWALFARQGIVALNRKDQITNMFRKVTLVLVTLSLLMALPSIL